MSAYKIIGQEWREAEKCGLSEIQLFKIPLLAIAVVKKSGHKDIFKQKLANNNLLKLYHDKNHSNLHASSQYFRQTS